MKHSATHDERIAKLKFGEIYPLYLSKISKKGRMEEELVTVISWLTGLNNKQIQKYIKEDITFKEFFANVQLNPKASEIKGMICGYRIEDIPTPLTKQIRYLDKLVDELAKGREMSKILRD
jgi:hypothetical protein